MSKSILRLFLAVTIFSFLYENSYARQPVRPPNILFIIMDDQSCEHLGCYGDKAVRTPNIDNLSRQGVKFANAYCAAPSCSPSRAAILTGQDIYRLEEGGVLTGILWKKFKVFPKIMESNGYTVGCSGKRYWPAILDREGAYSEAVGKVYASKKIEAPDGIQKNDYVANFEDFLQQAPKDKPFFFWMGIGEPHIPHPKGLGIRSGIDTSKIRVPAFFPDRPEIRLALADYLAEIEWADKAIGKMIDIVKEKKLLDNTIIVFTSDNGMPFPRAKATLYDAGAKMPMIISWPGHIPASRSISNPASLIDLAPTFLAFAGIDIPDDMTGRSLKNVLLSDKNGTVKNERKFVVTAFEKHTLCREGNLGFPRRAINTENWTYIKNYEPDRWPAGSADKVIPNWGPYGDIDPSGIKSYFLEHQHDQKIAPLFKLCFGKVPAAELYDRKKDPDMIHNLAADPKFRKEVRRLDKMLSQYLKQTKDPRASGLSPWDEYMLDKNP